MRIPEATLDATRAAAVNTALDAGKRGTHRVPDSVLFACGDPSDSLILKMVDAHARGLAEWEEAK
jgi:hypothetical protein